MLLLLQVYTVDEFYATIHSTDVTTLSSLSRSADTNTERYHPLSVTTPQLP